MKINKFLIIVFLFLIFLINFAYAETFCDQTPEFKNQGYACTPGTLPNLQAQGYDCKSGKVCKDGNFCCVGENYCCLKTEKSLCEKSFGTEGFNCVSGTRSELEKSYTCKPAGSCGGKDCCGSTAGIYCCNSSIQSTSKSGEILTTKKEVIDAFNFLKVNGIQTAIQEYQGLTIPKGDINGISYARLYDQSTSTNIKAQALYADALGYKQIAESRREFLGLPTGVIIQTSTTIKLQEVSATTAVTSPQPTITQLQDLSGIECGGPVQGYKCFNAGNNNYNPKDCIGNCQNNPDFVCCPTEKFETSIKTSKNIIIELSLEGLKLQYVKEEGWKWCKLGIISITGCGLNQVTDNSPALNEIDANLYLTDLNKLAEKNYDEGMDFIFNKVIQLILKEKYVSFVFKGGVGDSIINYFETNNKIGFMINNQEYADVVNVISLGSGELTYSLNQERYSAALNKITQLGILTK